MEYRFKADDWVRLTKEERASRCRLMAEEAMKLAAEADKKMSANYLRIAEDWFRLAREIEDTPPRPN